MGLTESSHSFMKKSNMDLRGDGKSPLFYRIGKFVMCGARIRFADSWKRRIFTTLFLRLARIELL